jgi:glycosyltransferase involved in cell wall biosynthesis
MMPLSPVVTLGERAPADGRLGKQVQARHVPIDPRQGLESPALAMTDDAIVVCSDLFERALESTLLARGLAEVSRRASVLVISANEGAVSPSLPQGSPEIVGAERLRHCLRAVGIDATLAGQTIALAGKLMSPLAPTRLPRCLAILSTFDDADIISALLREIHAEGFDIAVIDDGSTDGTYDELLRAHEHGIVTRLERREPSPHYRWASILERKTHIAMQAQDYDWVFHWDSDELRESPWPHLSLREGLACVEAMGFNAVDHVVLQFRPIGDGFGAGICPREFFEFCEFGKSPGHRVQIRGFKPQGNRRIQLASSGGHEAQFEGRRVFPLKFLLKHYPLRSPAQARRKVAERRQRGAAEARERRWHTHYDRDDGNADYLWSPEQLVRFDDTFYSKYLIERLTTLGVVP